MKALSTIAKGAGFVFLGMVVSKFLSYLYRVVIASLGPAEYGLLSIGLAVFGMLSVLSVLGLDTGVVRYLSEYKSKKDFSSVAGTVVGALKTSLFVSFFIGAALFLFAPFLATVIFHSNALVLLLRFFAVMIPFYAARDIMLAAVRAATQESYFDVIVRNVGENTLKLIFTFLLIGFGAVGAVSATAGALFVSFLFALYFCLRYIPYSPGAEQKLHLLQYSIPLLFSTLLIQIFVWSGTLIMGYYRSPAEVGIFNAALPTAKLLSIIPGGIGSLFLPVMTELYTQHKELEARTTYLAATKWIFFMNLPIYVIIMAFAQPLLSLIFGAEYGAGALALAIVATSYLLLQAALPSIETLKALKKTPLVLLDTGVAAVLCIVLSFLLVPQYGVTGGALATGLSFAAYGGLAIIQAYGSTRIFAFQLHFLKGIFAAAAAWFVVQWFFPPATSLSLLLGGAITIGLVYTMLIILFRSLSEEDKIILGKVQNKVKAFLPEF